MIETLSQLAPFVLLGVPVLAVTVRWVVLPLTGIIERLSAIEERHQLGPAESQRIAVLEAEVIELNRRIEQLSEAEAFRRELECGEPRRVAEALAGGS